ncbi:MAG TPA: PilZ domain-containing protein [Bryobacteraceae bacterium]|jgi:hypothetical protein
MEHRREIRTDVNLAVELTELEAPEQFPQNGVLKNVSRSGMLVRMAHGIASGSLVKVKARGVLTLGEVVRCQPAAEGFDVALALRNTLEDLVAFIQSSS